MMRAVARPSIAARQTSSEIDFRWGFEPEAWVGLRSAAALRGGAAPGSMEPVAPARHLLPRLMLAARSFFSG